MIEYLGCRNSRLLAGVRTIRQTDDDALLPSEAASFGGVVSKVRRQSGAARLVARTLLGSVGFPSVPIVKSSDGDPVWPSGIVGSLAHHDTVAAAASARRTWVAALGIDIEPNEPLPDDLVDLIATPREKARYDSAFLRERYIFVLKEAVYKAYFPVFKRMVDFQDIDVDLSTGIARVADTDQDFSIELLVNKNIIGLAYYS